VLFFGVATSYASDYQRFASSHLDQGEATPVSPEMKALRDDVIFLGSHSVCFTESAAKDGDRFRCQYFLEGTGAETPQVRRSYTVRTYARLQNS
jgi:hypothetical protein